MTFAILGFGSLRKDVVSTRVHYDCGCMLSETGAVLIGENVRRKNSELNVPGIYVVYFATFGALVSSMHLNRSRFIVTLRSP